MSSSVPTHIKKFAWPASLRRRLGLTPRFIPPATRSIWSAKELEALGSRFKVKSLGKPVPIEDLGFPRCHDSFSDDERTQVLDKP